MRGRCTPPLLRDSVRSCSDAEGHTGSPGKADEGGRNVHVMRRKWLAGGKLFGKRSPSLVWTAVSPVPAGIFTLQEEKLKALEQGRVLSELRF